jgi:hypothetical protein
MLVVDGRGEHLHQPCVDGSAQRAVRHACGGQRACCARCRGELLTRPRRARHHLPDIDGLEVARRLRNQGVKLAILFLTARDAT